jgi:Protein of unknown function (DUF998)
MGPLVSLLSGLAAFMWLAIIVVLHFIKPALDPRTRMMSEYAREPKGWIMQVAFYCMAAGCLAFAFSAWTLLPHLGLTLLAICGVSFAGAGVFVTDPVFITKGASTPSGVLHVVFAFIVTMLFPVAATIVGIAMTANAAWIPVHAWLPILSTLTWAGLLGFVVAAALEIKRKQTPVGYAQRFMALTYTVWLLVAALGSTTAA